MKHTLDYCDFCEYPMVRCSTCGNNGCNGMYGKVNGEQCPDCPTAYLEQDGFFEGLQEMDPYKASQHHIHNADVANAQENWLVAAREYERAAACQREFINSLLPEQEKTREVFTISVVALEKRAAEALTKLGPDSLLG